MTPADVQLGGEGLGRYILRQHTAEPESPLISYGAGAVLNLNRGKTEDALERRGIKTSCHTS